MSDTLVKCGTCGREERVQFSVCLARGWPRCHGQTMAMATTDADVGEATRDVIDAQLPPQPRQEARP
jgi:hypothetical protein